MFKRFQFVLILFLFFFTCYDSGNMIAKINSEKDDEQSLSRESKYDKWGFIDDTGKWVIEPMFDGIESFSEGLAGAKLNGKWGFIDKSGKWVIKPKFEFVYDFYEGLAGVKYNGKWGFIDDTGKWVIEHMFDKIDSFYDEFHRPHELVRVKYNGKWGVIDKTGKYIIEPIFDNIEALRDRWLKREFVVIGFNGKGGIFDCKNKKIVIEPKFDFIGRFYYGGLIDVKYNGKWGFIDDTGKWVIKPMFDGIESFSEGLAGAKLNGKWGFIDKSGKWVIKPKFEYVFSFSEGLAGVEFNGKWGFIDKVGKWFIEPKLDEILQSFYEGVAEVKFNGKWGVVDKAGKYVPKKSSTIDTDDVIEMLANAAIIYMGVKTAVKILDSDSDSSSSSRISSGSSSSYYSSNRGSLRFRFDGQWFFGYIKSLKIKIEGRNTSYFYTESSSSDYVFFTGVPYDTYDFIIYAYEQSGQSGQAHSFKGNISHKCKGTNVRISVGSNFIDPSVYVNCD